MVGFRTHRRITMKFARMTIDSALGRFLAPTVSPRIAIRIAIGAAFVMFAAPAAAHDIDPCVGACVEDSSECFSDLRDAFAECAEDLGCDVLRADYQDQCHVDDPDKEACTDARKALRTCAKECRTSLADDRKACRETVAACVEDQCGFTADDLARKRRRHRCGK
jgi:hypothetical protein